MRVVVRINFRYEAAFFKAYNTFRYQIVYDPISHSQRPLTNPSTSFRLADHPYLGVVEEDREKVELLAKGLIHPFSGEDMGIVVPEGSRSFSFSDLKRLRQSEESEKEGPRLKKSKYRDHSRE